jgi:hypothetical protein
MQFAQPGHLVSDRQYRLGYRSQGSQLKVRVPIGGNDGHKFLSTPGVITLTFIHISTMRS